MEGNQLFRETVKAMALGDDDRAQRLGSEISDGDLDAFDAYVTAVFAGTAGHAFAADQSHAAIRRFGDQMRQDFHDADPPLQPLVLEGLLRALFGEDHFMEEISAEDQLHTQALAIRKFVDQSDSIRERLDDHLNEAQRVAQQWMRQE